jgi:hypothetical protein
MDEPLPLGRVQDAVVEFLRGRSDAVLFGAQAVNVYADSYRMSEGVDLLSTSAAELAEAIRQHLNRIFHIAVMVRSVAGGKGFRVFQVSKPKNRHLVDVRAVPTLPPAEKVRNLLVLAPVDLIAAKTLAYHVRRGQPKAWTDRRDIAVLLLKFPKLKRASGPVRDCLVRAGASEEVLATWEAIAAEEILRERDEGY